MFKTDGEFIHTEYILSNTVSSFSFILKTVVGCAMAAIVMQCLRYVTGDSGLRSAVLLNSGDRNRPSVQHGANSVEPAAWPLVPFGGFKVPIHTIGYSFPA
jgi:hypothetical protein